jgi:hypothetical protein
MCQAQPAVCCALSPTDPSGGRLAELLVVLRKTLVRHTKEQKQGDRPLLALPSKSEEIVTGEGEGEVHLWCDACRGRTTCSRLMHS